MAKLLLVEDDNNLREIYEARLQAEGYTIVSAKDGEEALVVAKAEKPDLVISDVMMPKISGFEMLDIMRNTDELKGVKVIMLTALGQSDDQQRADKLGADRYLVKSQVTLEDIVKVAHELLEGDAAPAADAAATETPAPPATEAAPAADTAAPEAPAPEPVPAPEPAVEAEPVVAAPEEPKPEPAADDTAAKEDAEPAAEEKADVEAKIEDFVAGASSEPTAPAEEATGAADKPAEEPAAAPVTEPEPAPTAVVEPTPADEKADAAADSVSDDKLMADAVEKLSGNTDDSTKAVAEPAGDAAPSAPAAPTTTGTPIPVTAPDDTDAADKPAAEPTKPAEAAAKAETAPASPASMTHEKVIAPPEDNSEPKKDIKQLLADEEAKAATAGTAPGASITPSAGGADTKDGIDPNSIAL